MESRNTTWCSVLCLLLTCGMEPAYGAAVGGGGIAPADSGMIAGNVELNPADGGVSVPVEMDTTITVSLISVSLSADGFNSTVDPEQVSDISTPTAQMTSPDVTVVDHSVAPVKLGISSVSEVREEDIQFSEEFSDDVEQSFRLADTLSGVGPPGIVILVPGIQDKIYNSREEFECYAIRPGRTGIFVAEIPADGKAIIKLYGKVPPDFYGEFESTVRPALKISTVRVNEPVDLYRQWNKGQKKDIQEETKTKRTKEMAVLMLPMAMPTVWVGAAYGVEIKDPVRVGSADGNTTMTLTGTTKVIMLSVTIPTTVVFDIDMTAVSESGDISKANPQVSQSGPDTYEITNNSASSVWVYVSSVFTEADVGGGTPTLVNEYKTLLTDSYSLMFAIKDVKGDTTPLAVAGTEAPGMKVGTEGVGGGWTLSGSKNYLMNSEREKLIAKDQVSGVNAGKNEMGLRTYAYTRKGWQAGNSFKVKPVFTVSVTEPATT